MMTRTNARVTIHVRVTDEHESEYAPIPIWRVVGPEAVTICGFARPGRRKIAMIGPSDWAAPRLVVETSKIAERD